MSQKIKNGLISTDILKAVAVVTMFIDHIGGGILANWMMFHFSGTNDFYMQVYDLYAVIRLIGRISFPLFCYLLVQGFIHTRSRAKYALRLFIFAVISEIPFDYLFFNGITMEHQNVYWTLLISLAVLALINYVEQLDDTLFKDNKKCAAMIKTVMTAAITAAGMLCTHFIHTDYSWKGVLLIVTIYLTRKDRIVQTFLPPTVFLATYFLQNIHGGAALEAALGNVLETKLTVYISFILIYFCNGKREMKGGKYFFYAFYPVHMLLLLFVRYLLFN